MVRGTSSGSQNFLQLSRDEREIIAAVQQELGYYLNDSELRIVSVLSRLLLKKIDDSVSAMGSLLRRELERKGSPSPQRQRSPLRDCLSPNSSAGKTRLSFGNTSVDQTPLKTPSKQASSKAATPRSIQSPSRGIPTEKRAKMTPTPTKIETPKKSPASTPQQQQSRPSSSSIVTASATHRASATPVAPTPNSNRLPVKSGERVRITGNVVSITGRTSGFF